MNLDVDADRLLVVSDLHLGSPASRASQRLPLFLDHVLTPDWTLCINGDAVDLTQGSLTGVAADLHPILQRLVDFRARGGRILYTLGNHDLLLEHFLADLPFEVAPFFNVHAGGRRIRIEHGHVYEPSYSRWPGLYELGGRMAKPLLLANADVYRLWSLSQRTLDRIRRARDGSPHHLAADALLERGFDAVVLGHTHLPEVVHRDAGVFVNGGDWLTDSTFVRIEEGEISLERLVEQPGGLAVQRFRGPAD